MMCSQKSIFPLWPNLSSRSTLQQRVCHGCKSDLQLVNIRHVGRQRARELAALGMREPKDVTTCRPAIMTPSSQTRLGADSLDKIHAEIERVLKKSGAAKTRNGTTMPCSRVSALSMIEIQGMVEWTMRGTDSFHGRSTRGFPRTTLNGSSKSAPLPIGSCLERMP